MRNLMLCLGLLLTATGAHASLHPEKLTAFRLDRSPLLKGFVRSNAMKQPAAALVNPSGLTAQLDTRAFHGPSEIVYSVLLFSTPQTRDQAFKAYARSCQSPPNKTTLPCVGNFMIMVGGYNHRLEAERHNPRSLRFMLSDRELQRRVVAIRTELVRRAKSYKP